MPAMGFWNITRMSWKMGISARGLTDWLIKLMPVISTEKPTRMVTTSRFLPSLEDIISSTPIRATMGEKDSGFNSRRKKLLLSMPAALKIQAVRVVPTLEPMITPTVWLSCIMPEFTKPTSMTVMAEEDWMAMVITAPSASPFHLLEVMDFKTRSSLPPTIFSRPADMTCIPYRKKASPPNRVKREKTSMYLPPNSL